MANLLEKPILVSFYGDDFTGSTDVMESLALNGVRTALFLEAPEPDQVEQFRLKRPLADTQELGLQAFGVAGISRSLPTNRMREELDPTFRKMARIPSDFFQYKICSTFDSSPHIGSIGHAAEIALDYFPSDYVPLLVGAPFLNRVCVFGNLFARIDGITYRLDRHPTMSRHPVTPMRESDLRLHLGEQTTRAVELFDLFALDQPPDERQRIFERLNRRRGDFVLFDTYSAEHLLSVGRLIVENRSPASTQLIVGASSADYALTFFLQNSGRLVKPPPPAPAAAAKQILVMSGSCAPTTARQIEHALGIGFAAVRVDATKLVRSDQRQGEADRVVRDTLTALDRGASVVAFSAKGPDDPAVLATKQALLELGLDDSSASLAMGAAQGAIVRSVLMARGKLRTVVCGGDTSGHAARQLGVSALETLVPIAPGAPLCIAHSADPCFDGLEISLKGGQNGRERYLESVLRGTNLDA